VIRGFSLCLYFFMHLCLVHGKEVMRCPDGSYGPPCLPRTHPNNVPAPINVTWRLTGQANDGSTITRNGSVVEKIGEGPQVVSLDIGTLYCPYDYIPPTYKFALRAVLDADHENTLYGARVKAGCSTATSTDFPPISGRCCWNGAAPTPPPTPP